MLRHRAAMAARKYLDAHGFIDIETPVLYKSTPEGAREFLVPSRIHHGQFYALPQSPQLFKQMLMIAGFDRYYQIVKCFRDEDLRADRQPEFTQIDIETSFLDELEIRDMMEESRARDVPAKRSASSLPDPFPVMTYADAMRDYGSDKPDLRVPLKLTELTDVMRGVDFKVFRAAAELPNGRVAALRVPGGGTLTRKEIDDYTAFATIYGAKGLAYIKVNDASKPNEEGLQSPIVKFLTPERAAGRSSSARGAATGDLIFFGADRAKVVNDALGALRARIGHDRGLFEAGWKPLWVVDFPMFEQDEATGAWAARHHPFTAPKDGHEDRFATDPGNALAKAYDVVLNGWEIGGGSVRIHRPDVQARVFASLGISAEDQRRKFGFLLDALQYGAPPHGGIAFGLDRIVTMMAGAESIRDVIAFPKTQRGQDLLVDAPAPVDRAAAARPAHPHTSLGCGEGSRLTPGRKSRDFSRGDLRKYISDPDFPDPQRTRYTSMDAPRAPDDSKSACDRRHRRAVRRAGICHILRSQSRANTRPSVMRSRSTTLPARSARHAACGYARAAHFGSSATA